MRIVILDTPEDVSCRSADLICRILTANPFAVLGLATGGTPVATYEQLIARNQSGEVTFSQATTFNLDEYVGLPQDHPQSYYTFMHENLFNQTDFAPQRCHLPVADSGSLTDACERYEQMIDEAGGIDLQLLGIGSDGHIAFNEPSSSLASRTRVKALTTQTREDNARFFSSLDEVPKLAITMGVGTILESNEILLLATGKGKADAVRNFVEGPITAQVPASALQLHPRVTVLLDSEAASGLARSDYYRHVEKLQQELETLESN